MVEEGGIVVNIPTGKRFKTNQLPDGRVELMADDRITVVSSITLNNLYQPLHIWEELQDDERRKEFEKAERAKKKAVRKVRKSKMVKQKIDYRERVCDYVLKGMENVSKYGSYDCPDRPDDRWHWEIGKFEKKPKKVIIRRW